MGRICWLLLQVLGHILLVVNQADSSPANKTIRIGYLLQFKGVAGAMNVAIEQAQNDGLLRDYNFRYIIGYVVFENTYFTFFEISKNMNFKVFLK